MKAIELPRGGGKTTALVDYMLQPGNEDVIYVAPTFTQATRVARALFLQRGGTLEQAMGRFFSASNLGHPRPSARIVVDEADGVLASLLGRVERLAYTPDECQPERIDVDAERRRMAELRAEIRDLERSTTRA